MVRNGDIHPELAAGDQPLIRLVRLLAHQAAREHLQTLSGQETAEASISNTPIDAGDPNER